MEEQLPPYDVHEEKTALLQRDLDSPRHVANDSDPDSEKSLAQAKQRTKLLILIILIHALVDLVVVVGGFFLWPGLQRNQCLHGPDVIYSPAHNAVTYEPILMNNSLEEKNPFKAIAPTHEQTQAWSDLLSWQLLVISEDDLRELGRLNENSVKFEDGSGYLGALDMYHELHCLNYIREYIHRDYYTNKETPETQVIHVDHCIDILRQIIICHADTSIVTYDWVDEHKQPYPNFAIERECRSWDHMFEYIQSHQPDMHNGSFVHPKYGPVSYGGVNHGGKIHN